MPFLLIFILLPFAEIAIFFQVAARTGFWTALGLLFLGVFAGGALMRYQGFQTALAMRRSLRQGRAPGGELFDGFFLVVAGFLFILPGFASDALALALLFPGVRKGLSRTVKGYAFWPDGAQETRRGGDFGDVIEGEYEDLGETRTEKTLIEGGDKPGGS